MSTIKIPGAREEQIPRILNEHGCKVGVEIGVFKGHFSRHLLDHWNGTLWMVDPWRAFDDEEGYIDMSNHKNHETAYLEAMRKIEGLEHRAFMLRGLSSDMGSRFSDSELDFAYIDGNHAYEYVKQDIQIWWPKVKSGGFLMGHDYLDMDWHTTEFMENGKDKHIWIKGANENDPYQYAGHFGVNTAVDEFIEETGLDLTITSEWFGTWIIQKP